MKKKMKKTMNKKYKLILVTVILITYMFPKFGIFWTISFAIEPGERVDIPSATQYPQYGGNLEADYNSINWSQGSRQRELYEKWVSEGSKSTDDQGMCYITVDGRDWILVATSGTYGDTGDYLQVHINHDGEVKDYPMIIADIKNPSDSNAYFIDGVHYGHRSGDKLDILEFPYDSTKAGRPSGEYLGTFKNVEYIVNGGNYLNGDHPTGLSFTGGDTNLLKDMMDGIRMFTTDVWEGISIRSENELLQKEIGKVRYDFNPNDDVDGKKGTSIISGDILEVAEQLVQELIEKNAHYSLTNLVWGNIAAQYEQDEYVCCASYVSLVLYLSGALTEDQINAYNYQWTGGGGVPDMLEAAGWTCTYDVSQVQPGDIINDYTIHVMICAEVLDQSGNVMIWDQNCGVVSSSGSPPSGAPYQRNISGCQIWQPPS